MRHSGDYFSFSATEVGSFLACPHLSGLTLRVADGELSLPGQNDIERRLLEKRGHEHEARVLARYRERGLRVVDVKVGIGEVSLSRAFETTLEAMRAGADVIYQGTLLTPGWVGRPDFLVRASGPTGSLGHVYEPVDAKLAREVKARAVLQLCAYADQLSQVQGHFPRQLHVAGGGPTLEIQALWTRDYDAYFRSVRARMEAFVREFHVDQEPYPEPVEHCGVCRFWKRCEDRRRRDDHLSLVAGITRRQRDRLSLAGVERLEELARHEPERRVSGVALESLERVRRQAALQLRGRDEGRTLYELLEPTEPGVGLAALPAPSPGDSFLDLEGDAFAWGDGLEYLFGLLDDAGYQPFWAKTRAEEQLAFEQVIDYVVRRRLSFPEMHLYHFGHREADALKKLSCRHATREAEVDQLLREGVLVDLLPIVRHGLRASVESYSLKELEALHGFTRQTPLRDAARAMQWLGWWLETGEEALPLEALRRTVQSYNEDDCRSTAQLRDFLERLRSELEERIAQSLPRPARREAKPLDELNERQQLSAELARRLTEDAALPDAAPRALLATLLEFHWREAKSGWWEYHRARELAPQDRREDRACIAELAYEGEVQRVKQSAVHRYGFPEQEHALRLTPEPYDPDTQKAAGVIELGERHVLVKRGLRSTAPHPRALVTGKPIDPKPLPESLLALAQATLRAEPAYEAATALLYRKAPLGGAPLVNEAEEPEAALARLVEALPGNVLAVQGPPGTGKTYQAARLILRLLRRGQRVGVTANSHAVVKQVLERVVAQAEAGGEPELVRAVHVEDDGVSAVLRIDGKKERVRAELEAGRVNLVGGTAWTWAREDFASSVDALVVDEAGQMSLANALAVARAGRGLVLFGDPAQLEQPQQGVHPPGAEISALEHWLGGDALTIPAHLGVFLSQTRRLHPRLCDFVSVAFYEGRLKTTEGLGLERQAVLLPAGPSGSGLRFVPVAHRGNTNHAPEEVEQVARLVEAALSPGATFRDRSGQTRPLTPSDVLVVAPYNVQVAALRRVVPDGVRVGTVDKFQGREAPLVIYAMTSSSAEDAPRGLEFLYSRNRLNVAVSRAQALCLVVASPELVRASCKTPAQMRSSTRCARSSSTRSRRPLHLHVDAAALELTEHLLEALLARRGELGFGHPTQVVVLLVGRTSSVRRRELTLGEGASHVTRHRLPRPLQRALLRRSRARRTLLHDRRGHAPT